MKIIHYISARAGFVWKMLLYCLHKPNVLEIITFWGFCTWGSEISALAAFQNASTWPRHNQTVVLTVDCNYLSPPLDCEPLEYQNWTVIYCTSMPNALYPKKCLTDIYYVIPYPGLFWTIDFRSNNRQQLALLAPHEITGICLPVFKNLDSVKVFSDLWHVCPVSVKLSISFYLIQV